MARSFSQEARSDSQKIGEMRYRMSHLPSTTTIARTLLLAGILLAVTLLASRSFFPAFAQEKTDEFEFEENSTDSVAVYTATDPEGEDIVWSLLDENVVDGVQVDGVQVEDHPDHDDFSIDGGVLTFKSSPDYENPRDGAPNNNVNANYTDADNVYKVMVVIQAGDGNESTKTFQPVEVEVTNVDEPGSLVLSTAHPKVGVGIIATLTDPDGKEDGTPPITDTNFSADANTEWRWATSTSATGPWNDIKGVDATSNTYTPTKDDEGMFLRVTATYKDGHGKDDPFTDEVNELEHTIIVEMANQVLPLDYTNKPPKFPDQDPDTKGDQTAQTREVKEDAEAGAKVGAPVTASDKDAANQDEKLFYRLEDDEGDVHDDQYAFVIDSETAQISVGSNAMLDYDAVGADKRYVVVVRATDPGNESATTSVTIKVLDVDEDPEIEDAAGTDMNLTVKTVNEVTAVTAAGYSRFVSTYEAADQEDEDTELTWSLSGSDGSDFELNANNACSRLASTEVASVSLCFKEAPDRENTRDAGSNHTYDVRVNVRDTGGNTVSRDVKVTVDDVQEDTALEVLNLQPQIGTRIEADLDDPDGYSTSIEWQWATSTTPGGAQRTTEPGAWNALDTSDATDNGNYTPRESDVPANQTVYLWVSAKYTDGFSLQQTIYRGSVNPIKPRDDGTNDSPEFNEQSPGRSYAESEDTAGGLVVAALTVDDDTDMVGGSADKDVITFKLLDGKDREYFELRSVTDDSVEVWLVQGTMLDADTKNKYTVTVRATDPSNASDDVTVTLTVTDVNEAPEFTTPEFTTPDSNPPGHAIDFAENGMGVVETFVGDDPEGSSIEWTLEGVHADAFTIQGGQLKFVSPPDYESPSFIDDEGRTISVGANNPYSVTVQAGDGSTDNTPATVTVTVTVTNEEEGGAIQVDTFRPKVDALITATLVDDDIPSSDGQTWQWATSTKDIGPWYPVADSHFDAAVTNNRSTYTPRENDAGMYLRVMAIYDDGNDEEKEDDPDTVDVNESKDTAPFVFASKVFMADYTNMAPKFPDQDPDMEGDQTGTTTKKVKEDADPGDLVGAEVAAEDEGADGQQEDLFYRLVDADEADDTLPNNNVDDDAFFVINSATGQISVDTDEKLNFESVEEYKVRVTATDPGGMTSAPIVVTIKVLNVNESPKLGDEDQAKKSNLASARYKENPTATTTEVSTYSATDDEDSDSTPGPQKALKWALSGADMDLFSICLESANATCGESLTYGQVVELRFKKSPNFEARADSNGDNVYNVTVEAKDSDDNVASRDVTITLENEDDPGKVTLSSIQPEAGSEIRAELTDPDGRVTGIDWQWQLSTNEQGPYDDIAGATSGTYVPSTSDAERPTFLRAVAEYTDAHDANKTATSHRSQNAVQNEDADNQPPAFPDQDINTEGFQTDQTRYVVEETKEAQVVANKDGSSTSDDPVKAIDTEARLQGETEPPDDPLTYTLSGPDASLFTIASSTAVVSLRKDMKVDYETRDTYTVEITATDPSLESDTMTLTIKAVKMDEMPKVSKRGLAVSGDRSINVAEGSSGDLATYTASGADASGARWSLEGTDAGDFNISSGILAFRSTPNYESPADSNSDNVYSVTVKATSGNISATRSVTVVVTNVDEDGSVTISSPGNEVKVGVQLTAELDESDEEVVTGWQWSSGGSNTGPWNNISGATSDTYTPDDGDVGSYLRVTVNYTDATFGSDSLNAVTASAVAPVPTGVEGEIVLVAPDPTVGKEITAVIRDGDGSLTNISWQWARSEDGSTGWTDIGSPVQSTNEGTGYTPVEDDAGQYLRVTVTYNDASGSNQTAGPTAPTDRVKLHTYDADADGRINRSEVIQAIRDFLVEHSISRAEVIEVIRLYLTIR